MKEFIVKKSSVMEIQNLVVNDKSELVQSNSKQYQKYISSKNQWKFFLNFDKINDKNPLFFLWSF